MNINIGIWSEKIDVEFDVFITLDLPDCPQKNDIIWLGEENWTKLESLFPKNLLEDNGIFIEDHIYVYYKYFIVSTNSILVLLSDNENIEEK